MKYADIITNDFSSGVGVTVSLWVQGCPHHCVGCHNPETWDFEGGRPLPSDWLPQLIKAINANGVQRNFSVLGGEPLCPQNKGLVLQAIEAVRKAYPNILIYVWTGSTIEKLKEQNDEEINKILELIDVLIDGPFILARRDIRLPLRGSDNQRILKKGIDF